MGNYKDYANVLSSWYGYSESTGKDDIIIKLYNDQRESGTYKMTMNDPWCHATVSAAAYKSGNSGAVPNTAYCPTGINWFKARGLWFSRTGSSYNPSVGDIIYYDWGGDAVSDHVGTIIARSGNVLTVREGNKNNMLCDRTISASSTSIMGYGRPKWGGTIAPTPPNNNPNNNPSNSTRTWLQLGDKGDKVKDVQNKLIAIGIPCGKSGADGDYGKDTVSAVKSFQGKMGISVDGQAGEITMAKLNHEYSNKNVVTGNSRIDTKSEVQSWLNTHFLSNVSVDGIFGSNTKAALVRALQQTLNNTYKTNLSVDGTFGPNTRSAIKVVKSGAKGYMVGIIQAMLVCKNMTVYVDNDFGSTTESAVRTFQSKSGLVNDGQAGKDTFTKLFS